MFVKLAATPWVTEFTQSFHLQLADALTGQAEALPDFLERKRMLAADPEVQARDFRFARMQEKDGLSDAQVAHCRQVTWVWVGFFALNASIAAVLASNEAWVSAWATYNGGIAYALMGVLFAGEYVVRQYRFRRYGDGLHDRLLRRIFPPRGDT